MIEDFWNALQNFRTNKMRTILSLLGIIIGVTSVVIITTLGHSLEESIAGEFTEYNMNLLKVRTQANLESLNNGVHEPLVKFDDEFRNNLLKRVPKIKNVFLVSSMYKDISRRRVNIGSKNIEPAPPNRLKDLKVEIDYGRFFNTSDHLNAAYKVIIGSKVALELFPEGNAVGKKISVKRRVGRNYENIMFEVVGVLTEGEKWFVRTLDTLYIPASTYKKLKGGRGEDCWDIEVIAYNPNDIEFIKNEIKKIAKEAAPPSNYRAVYISSAKSQLDQMHKVLGMVQVVIVAIASISLLVGGIGIMNIMLVTVTERKKEIGIRKALGATNRAIQMQFLVESATLTLTGGVIGVTFGILISRLLFSGIVPFPDELKFHFNPTGTIIAFTVSVFIGVFFGLHPAIKASKLDPVVALSE
ncbi:MAG: ABC transporter substrate-binding protein [Treponema sp.]|nr:MAG: ABC transporter substrate-binding protein [Treponema sp.]